MFQEILGVLWRFKGRFREFKVRFGRYHKVLKGFKGNLGAFCGISCGLRTV